MPLLSSADAVAMLRDVGDVVVYNGTSTYGLVESVNALEPTDGGGVMQVRKKSILIATGELDDLIVGGRVQSGGVTYRIDEIDPDEDNELLTRLYVARLS